MKTIKAKGERAMTAGKNKEMVKRLRSERPYLRAVKSVPPTRPVKRKTVRAVARPVDADIRGFDPLARESKSKARKLMTAALYWLLAATIHAALVASLVIFGDRGRNRLALPPAPEKVTVRISEPKMETPAPGPEIEEPEAPIVPPEKPVEAKREKELPRVKPKEVSNPKVADPVDIDSTSTPTASDSTPRRKVVGISFESTVTGGKGPAFAVGNTRMGATESKAVETSNLGTLPKGRSSGEDASANRVAAAIPTSGVSLVKPKRVANIEPIYPALLKSQGTEGNVVVLIRIDAAGMVSSVKVVKGSGFSEFDIEAEKAAKKERFSPALRNGEPIEYTLSYTYRFRVRES